MAENTKFPFLESEDIPYKEPGETWLQSVPEGWQPMFLEMCQNIVKACEAHNYPATKVTFLQVKEKFGALRVYWHLEGDENHSKDLYDKIDALIENAEQRSYNMCHVCGKEADWHSTGWVLPYCDACARAWNARANERHKTNYALESAFRPISKA